MTVWTLVLTSALAVAEEPTCQGNAQGACEVTLGDRTPDTLGEWVVGILFAHCGEQIGAKGEAEGWTRERDKAVYEAFESDRTTLKDNDAVLRQIGKVAGTTLFEPDCGMLEHYFVLSPAYRKLMDAEYVYFTAEAGASGWKLTPLAERKAPLTKKDVLVRAPRSSSGFETFPRIDDKQAAGIEKALTELLAKADR